MTRQLHFNAFLMSSGHHEAAWRLPESDPFANTDLKHWINLAQIAERGGFDSLFLADGPALWGDATHRPCGALEPTVLLTALAAVTSHIGLIATASTTYNDPYNLARRFASLDHISGGRAGWNIVTTATRQAARNFGLDDNPSHRERYRRAAEFTDVSIALWDSWEDDAEIGDKAAGVYAAEAKIHEINYTGEYFQVRGPLNVPRSPQGRPLLVQAGSSEDGREFAARYAEAVFTAQQTLADAQEFYADLKARARRLGRDPDQIKILPGLVPAIGSTEAEARALEDELESLIVPDYGLNQLAQILELPPEALPLDGHLPASVYSRTPVQGMQSRYQLVVDLARRDNLTVRQLIARLGGGRGHRTFAGTPEQVADIIEEWADSGAADGFNVMPPVLPSGLEAFVDQVIPILRKRGLFREQYTTPTLRGHYNLPRPPSQFSLPGATSIFQVRLVDNRRMGVTDQYLKNNEAYAARFSGPLPLPPASHVAVVACMDARLNVYAILGLEEGEAHVIRNAGGVVTDDEIRSLAISQRLLATTEVILIHHTDCGMLTFTDDSFKRTIQDEVGIKPEWAAEAFTDLAEDVRQSIARIKASPFIPHKEEIRGFVFDVATGKLDEVI